MPHRESAVSRVGVWAVDESHDLIEAWLVAIGGIDLQPGRIHRDPIECSAPACKIRPVTIGPRVGVHPPDRVVLSTLHDPPERHIVGGHAVDDTQPRKIAQRLKTRPPDVILERSLSDSRDPRAQQQLHDTKEDGKCPHRQLIAQRRGKSGIGMSHAFLDLIPAYGRAPHQPREPMRQRGLASAYGAADNHESWQRGHLTVIANANPAHGELAVRRFG